MATRTTSATWGRHMDGREVPEWIGATPNTPVPKRVRLRVFERHGGICHISGRKIMAGELWECDHVKALINGGENRETNLRPALKDKHKAKTAEDVGEKSKTNRVRLKHLGQWPKGQRIHSRPFPSRRREVLP
jgi:5-methylcytosine-specific restriction protein A